MEHYSAIEEPPNEAIFSIFSGELILPMLIGVLLYPY